MQLTIPSTRCAVLCNELVKSSIANEQFNSAMPSNILLYSFSYLNVLPCLNIVYLAIASTVNEIRRKPVIKLTNFIFHLSDVNAQSQV